MIGETGSSGTSQQGTRKTTSSDKHCVIADFWSHSIPQHRGGKLQLSTTHQLTFFLSILAVFLGKTKGKRAYLLVCLFVFFFIRFLFETLRRTEMIPAVLDEMLLRRELRN